MIRFSLSCGQEHEFEAWFGSNDDFDSQKHRGLVSCPVCGSADVTKALMAPAVPAPSKREERPLAMDPNRREVMRKLREMVQSVRASSEDVGDRFPEEARKIHHGEAEARGIIGRATGDEARSLIDEGIEIAPLPEFPEEKI
ncbi:hypothetical protein DFR52_10511 [Hoeflea marina]|uniref:DUF1178 family protein n=1 Tax=Hoeflea marina TaxID=274592 RepID=A0A317PG88_9HYPH|nr:DUF1178 family protein [Hoeflea marina]PWV98034.1 hypothetical protein DFR52_10511 [Hoeflea marina]